MTFLKHQNKLLKTFLKNKTVMPLEYLCKKPLINTFDINYLNYIIHNFQMNLSYKNSLLSITSYTEKN